MIFVFLLDVFMLKLNGTTIEIGHSTLLRYPDDFQDCMLINVKEETAMDEALSFWRNKHTRLRTDCFCKLLELKI